METAQGPFEASAAAAASLMVGIIFRMTIEEMALKTGAVESTDDDWISIIAAYHSARGVVEC
jgi:hypothetical protein